MKAEIKLDFYKAEGQQCSMKHPSPEPALYSVEVLHHTLYVCDFHMMDLVAQTSVGDIQAEIERIRNL